ncbi:MAG: hypothetical protein M1834_005458 [Cirrosporium novae-zelandiae]|nr:MAG: hypothetical protein M1834_005458 [Cirrosporium novae-zelandiae]
MAWSHLEINKPHLAYIILGGFTSLFMLCSLFVKEKMYIGEATVASICGIIFGPHAANLFNPESWGNVDEITLECSRIVLVVQCFAVGVELPKSYMERHWKSVTFLLVPVMTYGWLSTSLFIWWMIRPLTWLESLACAACVTATDPVLASSVVGKGKFAKRVPKHLRDLLSAESGCNDGMAFPFIYLSVYLIDYNLNAKQVTFHWILYTILYECIFGAIYGFVVGYVGRHAIKYAEEKGLIDRESFLVFYFVLALFCAGSGSILGVDDLLVGFSAGVGFSNDGWFTKKTEESHVSNVIDLLLNLAYFVYLGSIIPWNEYNMPEWGITPWRLVIIAIFVILFRRIPIMLALKPIIPDVKNWREALFAGHFGPIGVGAIFAAILTRAELEGNGAEPTDGLPGKSNEEWLLIRVLWPITTFLVISSIIVHGSSIAVFTLGKRINTLAFTLSYTRGPEEGQSWMDRLPRFDTKSRTLSLRKSQDLSIDFSDEKLPQFPAEVLPRNFLRRQREEDYSTPNSRASSQRPISRKKKRWDEGRGPGGPISKSAITPQRIQSPTEDQSLPELSEKTTESPDDREEPPDGVQMRAEAEEHEKEDQRRSKQVHEPAIEAYQEGKHLIIEDEEGNVLGQEDVRGEGELDKRRRVEQEAEALEKEDSGEHAKGLFHPHEKTEGDEIEKAVGDALRHPNHPYRNLRQKLGEWHFGGRPREENGTPAVQKPPEQKRGPAYAYQYGDTIIVEDEDGEVIKKYNMPRGERGTSGGAELEPAENKGSGPAKPHGFQRLGTFIGLGPRDESYDAEVAGPSRPARRGRKLESDDEDDDPRLRFVDAGGRRMSKAEFIRQIQAMDPKARAEFASKSNIPEAIKHEAREAARKASPNEVAKGKGERSDSSDTLQESRGRPREERRPPSPGSGAARDENDTAAPEDGSDLPSRYSMSESLARFDPGHETAAQRRRRQASEHRRNTSSPVNRIASPSSADTTDDSITRSGGKLVSLTKVESHMAEAGETEPERRRRLAALGKSAEDSDSDDDGGERKPPEVGRRRPVEEPSGSGGVAGTASRVTQRVRGIRFAPEVERRSRR